MSRRRIAALLPPAALLSLAPAVAAQDAQTGTPPERIDLTVPAPPMKSTEEECKRRSEAAVVSGEIVVCGARPGEGNPRYSSSEEAANRHAAKTAFRDDPATPDVAGAGIFRGPATVSGLCVKGVFNCPRPPALMVDVTKLPQAPPGSDADRIARGLAPLGEDAAAPARPLSAPERAELGLPERPPPSPARSAAPAAPQ